MEYRILGPLEVLGDDGPLRLGGAKQRAVLALLLLHSGRAVSQELFIDELWGDAPPDTARETVHVYVSRLRKALPAGSLVREGAGYALQVAPDAFDLARFERLREEGRFHEALALWRGPPLAEFGEEFARVEGRRLQELRLSTVEERLDADLARGRHAELVGELEALVGAHPHRERLRGQLMLALYRSGRQAEALAAYRQAWAALEELGIEPCEELRRLERQILMQDAALTPPRAQTGTVVVRLPAPATSFVGRERELIEIADLVEGGARVVTLTGAAGAGKSRLAVEVASRIAHAFPDGVFFVPLEDVRDPALVVPAIANALGVDAVAHPVEAAVARLTDRRVLLVVDNFEQVLDAAPALARLVTSSSVFLVTSRAPLNIAAERLYPVPALAQSDARALFVERARAVRPDFDMSRAVGEICRRLDGLPLAIELAAARVRLMTPEVMLPRLGDRLSLLTRGPSERSPRQQTLRAALDWSYDLLPHDARSLFARLSVFAGGFDLSGVEGICDGDLESFQALVDYGLIEIRGERFALLESIREYSSERLAVDPTAAHSLRLRHAEYYASLGKQLIEMDRAAGGHQIASERLVAEVGNFEAAYDVLRESARPADALRVVEALAGGLDRVGRRRQALRVLEDALLEASLAPADRASMEAQAAWLAADVGEFEKARSLASLALEHTRSADDAWGEITALAAIWESAVEEGDLVSADDALREAETVARLRLPQRLANVLNDRSVIALERGEYDRARELLGEAVENASATTFGPWMNLALSYLLEDDLAAAEPLLRRMITKAREEGATFWVFYALHGFVVVYSRDDPERAALLSGALDSLGRSVGIQLQHLELRLATQTRDALASRLGGRLYELETAGAEMELDDVVALALAS